MQTLFGHILTSNGKNLVTAVNGGGLGTNNAVALNTNRTIASTWETFTLVLQGGSPPIGPGMKFALKTLTGNYVTAVSGGGVGGPNDITCPVHTDQTIADAGAWELFTLLVNDSVNPSTVQIMPFTTNPTNGAGPNPANRLFWVSLKDFTTRSGLLFWLGQAGALALGYVRWFNSSL
ncbi:MAG TPA: hypothetical protein VKS22_06180 [Candidatus Binataceae bacterium]|nr:hypothetical protein [Candidatus Binataceae bacterium]